jgi:hypothetical protein
MSTPITVFDTSTKEGEGEQTIIASARETLVYAGTEFLESLLVLEFGF